MGIFKSLIKTAVDVVTLPIDVAADVLTLGEAEATKNKGKKLVNDVDEIIDETDKLI